ncbi:Plasmodium exported protein, unknown function [Plasmodium vivax]|nr:Plasmodium exported protein, unknown function [Plasmodium vivax]
MANTSDNTSNNYQNGRTASKTFAAKSECQGKGRMGALKLCTKVCILAIVMNIMQSFWSHGNDLSKNAPIRNQRLLFSSNSGSTIFGNDFVNTDPRVYVSMGGGSSGVNNWWASYENGPRNMNDPRNGNPNFNNMQSTQGRIDLKKDLIDYAKKNSAFVMPTVFVALYLLHKAEVQNLLMIFSIIFVMFYTNRLNSS